MCTIIVWVKSIFVMIPIISHDITSHHISVSVFNRIHIEARVNKLNTGSKDSLSCYPYIFADWTTIVDSYLTRIIPQYPYKVVGLSVSKHLG